MAEVIKFVPKQQLNAQDNLADFIAFARELSLWSDLQDGHGPFVWENPRWLTSHDTAIRFINYESADLHHSKVPEPHQLMDPAFMDTAKAVLRYHHTVAPHKSISRDMTGLRALEHVLRADMGTPDITRITQRHFDQFTVLLEKTSSRQFVVDEILKLLATLADFYIVPGTVRFWKNPYVGQNSYAHQNGGKAPAHVKAMKLPDQDALLAIAEVFGNGYAAPLDDGDVMVTSLTCLFLSAPMRINEPVRFRFDCLSSETDKDGNVQYHIRYWVPKTKEFARKPIPTTMAEHTIEAVRRLREITDEGRKLALYLEGNPTKFYRHANCPNVPDDQILTPGQVVQALGFNSKTSAENFIKRHKGNHKLTNFTLNSLWQLVLAEHRELNPHFPYQENPDKSTHPPLKMSQSLLCFRRSQLSNRRGTSPVLLAPFEGSFYAKRLDASEKGRGMCFFTRHGYDPIKTKSHMFRHFLNQLAEQNGVSIDAITEWSNRASSRQTMTYVAPDPAKADAKGAALFDMNQQEHITKAPITEDEAEHITKGPHHRSKYGLCRRSIYIGPCNKFGDCLNCSEILICKGDRMALQVIKFDRDNIRRTLENAQDSLADGVPAATRWVKKVGPQLEKLDQLVAIMENPEIADDTALQIRDATDFSHERALIEKKAETTGIKLDKPTVKAIRSKDLRAEFGDEMTDIYLSLINNGGGENA